MKLRVLRILLLVMIIALAVGTPGPASAVDWSVGYASPVQVIPALAVFDGKLYAGGMSNTQTNAHLFVFDGNDWSDIDFASKVGVAVNMIESLEVFNGQLFIGARTFNGTTYNSRVYSSYDGTTFTQDFSGFGNYFQSGIGDLAIHDGELYATVSVSNGEVFKRIGANNWVSVGGAFTSSQMPRALASYQGSLYVGTNLSGAVVSRWNGSTWDLAGNLTTLLGIPQTSVWSLAADGNTLYAGPVGTMALVSSTIPAFDGTDWVASQAVIGNTRVREVNGQVWAGALDGKIYRNVDGTWQAMGQIPNYAFDFAEYKGFIYAAGSDGKIYRRAETKPWLLMYYMAGDSYNVVPGDDGDLSPFMEGAISDLSAVSNDNVYIAIFKDLSNSTPQYLGWQSSNQVSQVMDNELNTGDPQTLVDFMNWARSNFPADHSALIIINHGNALTGVAKDRNFNSGDNLDPNEYKSALSSAGRVNILYMHTCLMGNLEAQYQVKDLTDFYVGSENEGWSTYPVRGYISSITSETTPRQLAINMANDYFLELTDQNKYPSNISVVDMSKIDDLAQKTSTLAGKIQENSLATYSFVWSITDVSVLQRFDSDDPFYTIDNNDVLADLYDFARMASVEPLFAAAAEDVMSAINAAVIYNEFWSGSFRIKNTTYEYELDDSHGISIGLPRNPISYYNPTWLDFAEGANWTIAQSPAQSIQGTISGLGWGAFISDLVLTNNPDAPNSPNPPELVKPLAMLYYMYIPVVTQ